MTPYETVLIAGMISGAVLVVLMLVHARKMGNRHPATYFRELGAKSIAFWLFYLSAMLIFLAFLLMAFVKVIAPLLGLHR